MTQIPPTIESILKEIKEKLEHFTGDTYGPEFDTFLTDKLTKLVEEAEKRNFEAIQIIIDEAREQGAAQYKLQVMEKIKGMMKRGPGGHGQCCMCQECKNWHEECTCTHNAALTQLQDYLTKEI